MLLVVSSVLVAINFASRINRPLNKIFTASKEISKGNYNINLPSDKNSDFNVLNYTFTEMSEKIKEQEQRSKLSGRFEAWEIIGKKLAHEIGKTCNNYSPEIKQMLGSCSNFPGTCPENTSIDSS